MFDWSTKKAVIIVTSKTYTYVVLSNHQFSEGDKLWARHKTTVWNTLLRIRISVLFQKRTPLNPHAPVGFWNTFNARFVYILYVINLLSKRMGHTYFSDHHALYIFWFWCLLLILSWLFGKTVLVSSSFKFYL